jgi:hypothetical protein
LPIARNATSVIPETEPLARGLATGLVLVRMLSYPDATELDELRDADTNQ